MKNFFATLSICVIFLFTGCIERDFDLAETSGEMTIGGEELVVPLANISNIYLSDLLKENESIKSNDNGVYQISFSSFGDDPTKYESIAIDGISIPAITDLSPVLDPMSFELSQLPTTLELPDIKRSQKLKFPNLGSAVDVTDFEITETIKIQLPPQITGEGTLPESVASILPPLEESFSNGSTKFNAEITIKDDLDYIEYVYFNSEEKNILGAPFNVAIDLRGIKGINGGGTLDMNMTFPEGYFFLDENGNPLSVHNVVSRTININKGDAVVHLDLYLQKINYNDHKFTDGFLQISDEITYSYDLKLNACGGDFNANQMPIFTISAKPEYQDIEVHIKHIELDSVEHPVEYKFDGLPKEVDINTIAFKNSPMMVQFEGLHWFVVKDLSAHTQVSPILEIVFPKCMHFEESQFVKTYQESVNGVQKSYSNVIMASTQELYNGIALYLDYIDCKESNGNTTPEVSRDENGLIIKSNITTSVHLESLDNHTILASSLVPEEGILDNNEELTINISMTGMTFNLDNERSEIAWGEDKVFDLNLNDQAPSISQEIHVPEMISSIESIAIGKANSNGEPVGITFSLGALNSDSFPIETVGIDLKLNLGKMLNPTKETISSGLLSTNENGDYILTINKDWNPKSGPLTEKLEFDALKNIPAVENGKIKLDQAITIDHCRAIIKGGQDIDLTTMNNTEIKIDIAIDDIEPVKFTGGFDLAVKPDEMVVELGDISSLGVNINELNLNPVLKLNLKENPTGIPFFANIEVATLSAEGEILTEISAPNIEINKSGATNIVISTPKNADKFENATFIEIEELSKLLSSGLPAKIVVNMAVESGKDTYTIDLSRAKDGYKLDYQYEVIVPFEFDGDVNLSYETTITGMSDTFNSLAGEGSGLKVGDVGLLAEFGTTIPFNIKLEAELINADGTTSGIDARLKIDDGSGKGNGKSGTINGWTQEDGENHHASALAIEFNLGDSHSLAGLKGVDGVKLTFTLTDTDTGGSSALAGQQYLNGNIKLRVRDGLTVDIFGLLNGNE